jgi:hypothetical protein
MIAEADQARWRPAASGSMSGDALVALDLRFLERSGMVAGIVERAELLQSARPAP